MALVSDPPHAVKSAQPIEAQASYGYTRWPVMVKPTWP